MIEVNLLPAEYRRVERTPLPRLVVLVVGISVIAVAAFYLVHVGYFRLKREKDLTLSLKEEIDREKKRADKYDQLMAEIGIYEARRKAIGVMWEERTLWSVKLDQLCDLVPNFIGLRRLEFSPSRVTAGRTGLAEATAGTLTMQCISATADEKRLAHLLRVLKGEVPPDPPIDPNVGKEFFADFVRIEDSGWEKGDFEEYVEKEALEFRLDLLLKPLKPEKPATAPAQARRQPVSR